MITAKIEDLFVCPSVGINQFWIFTCGCCWLSARRTARPWLNSLLWQTSSGILLSCSLNSKALAQQSSLADIFRYTNQLFTAFAQQSALAHLFRYTTQLFTEQQILGLSQQSSLEYLFRYTEQQSLGSTVFAVISCCPLYLCT